MNLLVPVVEAISEKNSSEIDNLCLFVVKNMATNKLTEHNKNENIVKNLNFRSWTFTCCDKFCGIRIKCARSATVNMPCISVF